MSLKNFVRSSRVKLSLNDPSKTELRVVSVSHINKVNSTSEKLSNFVADRAPLFYRDFDSVVESLKDEYYLSTFLETLQKLPSSEHFQDSHFGEIVSGIFVQDVIGLTRVYSKLSLNTTQNQNAYKMDLVCYVPGSNPVEFVFCEVKSSPKEKGKGVAAHDTSCYADIFKSLRKYSSSDKQFDLTTIKDKLTISDQHERSRVRESLKPYASKKIGYIGIAVIDSNTYSDEEAQILMTRSNDKKFDVELLCVESYKEVSTETYELLNKYLKVN